jgi:hypothetical protein
MLDHLFTAWRIVRGTFKQTDAAHVNLLDGRKRQPIGRAAVKEDRYFARIDWTRPEPDRVLSFRDLDELRDTQREQSRRPVVETDGLIRGETIDSGVLLATPPRARETF